MHRNKHGFTLLELIIVVIIIGILASIALPRYIRIAEKGRVSEAKTLLGSIKAAQIRYSAQYGVFTDDYNLLDIVMQTPKFFDYVAVGAGAVDDEDAVVSTATRTTVDNPGLGAYTIDITQRGELIPTGLTNPEQYI